LERLWPDGDPVDVDTGAAYEVVLKAEFDVEKGGGRLQDPDGCFRDLWANAVARQDDDLQLGAF
jgi:hypothetical protein